MSVSKDNHTLFIIGNAVVFPENITKIEDKAFYNKSTYIFVYGKNI